MQMRYERLDVFTDVAFGGNPLAVFLDAPPLTAAQMQAMAREMNLSESVFVGPRTPEGDWPIRIFTPRVELPFAGHPTLGTAVALLLAGALGDADVAEFSLLEEVGPVPVRVRRTDARRGVASFRAPRAPSPVDPGVGPEALADMLTLRVADLLDGDWRPRGFTCGVPFLFVAVRSLDAIGRARLRREAWERHLSRGAAPHVYLFTQEVERSGSSLHARMFAPAMGIEEDPATGGAAAALAGMLVAVEGPRTGHAAWRIEQGMEMNRPSLIDLEVEVEDGCIVAVRLTGSGVMLGGGQLEIPP